MREGKVDFLMIQRPAEAKRGEAMGTSSSYYSAAALILSPWSEEGRVAGKSREGEKMDEGWRENFECERRGRESNMNY